MSAWEYCYVNESLEPVEGGGLARDYFKRPVASASAT